jgi:hypothetical protein
MRIRFVASAAAAVTAASLWLGPTVAARQGQPAAPAYTPPRTPDGQPDLQGVWQALNSAAWDIQDHQGRLGVPAGQGVVEGNVLPYKTEALAQRQKNYESRETLDTEAKCYRPGVPRITYMPFPFQIHQFPGYVLILYEYAHIPRVIYTDGSRHPEGHIDWWMGDSRGRWEGNTLVVDVVDFNEETWFDRAGNFHSDELHLVERYTRTGPDHIRYEATIEDPKVFTRPWKMSMPLYRRQEPNVQLLEYDCAGYLDDGK